MFEFQYIYLIVAGIVFILFIFALLFAQRFIAKKENVWIDKVYPELNKIRDEKLNEIIDNL